MICYTDSHALRDISTSSNILEIVTHLQGVAAAVQTNYEPKLQVLSPPPPPVCLINTKFTSYSVLLVEFPL